MAATGSHQRRQQHHADAEHPDDAGQQVVREVKVERPGDADDGQLEDHQDEPACHEIACECAGMRQLAAIEKRAGTGQEREGWRAEMRDPPREEDAGRRSTRGLA